MAKILHGWNKWGGDLPNHLNLVLGPGMIQGPQHISSYFRSKGWGESDPFNGLGFDAFSGQTVWRSESDIHQYLDEWAELDGGIKFCVG